MKQPSFLRRVGRRPPGAKLPEHDEIMDAGSSSLGGYRDSPTARPSSSASVHASPALAAIMSEQQAIISALRDLKSSGLNNDALICSVEFTTTVGRLQRVQSDQRSLLSSSGGHVGSTEQKLLVRQSQTIQELLTALTSSADSEPPPPPPCTES